MRSSEEKWVVYMMNAKLGSLNPIRTGGPPYGFCPCSKNLLTTNTWNILTFPNFWLRIPLWYFFSRKFCVHPPTAVLRHPVQKYFLFCALIKKLFFTKPSWNNFFDLNLGPPYNQKEEKRKFHIWSVGYQYRVKRVIGAHFWFFVEKGQILRCGPERVKLRR